MSRLLLRQFSIAIVLKVLTKLSKMYNQHHMPTVLIPQRLIHQRLCFQLSWPMSFDLLL